MSGEVSVLLWKEVRQIPRKRAALLTAVLFPLLFFVVLPVVNILGVRSGAMSAPTVGVGLPLGLSGMRSDPTLMVREFTLPLFVALGGLIIPSVTATYTIIGERERRTVELLVALPVSLGRIVLAKLLAVLLLGVAVAVPLFIVDAVVMIATGLGSVGDAAVLLFLLLATLLYSTASALFVALLAGDYRTANNLNGAMLGPIILLSMAALFLLPGGMLRVVLLGAGYVVLAIVFTVIALRSLTIERFLR